MLGRLRPSLPSLYRLFLSAVLLLTWIQISAQQSLSIEAPTRVLWCEPVIYRYTLENNENATSENSLEMRFSQNVKLLSFDGNISLTRGEGNYLIFGTGATSNCSFSTGTITIIPDCDQTIPTLEAKANLGVLNSSTPQECTATAMSNPLVAMGFGNYRYDAGRERISKTISLTNVGTSDISELFVDLSIPGDFSRLISSSEGTIDRDQIRLDPSNFANLQPRETRTIELIYDLLDCAIAPIQYDLIFECSLNGCINRLPFVDDNENSTPTTTISGFTQYQFGICEPEYNTLTIKNESDNIDSPLNDAYDVEIALLYANGRANDCQEFDFRLGDQPLSYSDGTTQYIVAFADMMEDPDGPGGLSDLDGDGLYDDLAIGDSISIEYGVRFYIECANQTGRGEHRIIAKLNYDNICGSTTTSNNLSVGPIIFSAISDISWTDLPKDETGQRFINVGDTLPWVVNFTGNLPNQFLNCENPNYTLDFYTPPNLMWIEDIGILFESREDSSIILLPYEKVDTVIRVDVTELPRGVFTITYEGICPPDALIDVDPNTPLYLQCIEWNDYVARARLNINCDFDASCEPAENFRESVSTRVRTLCLDLENDYAIINSPGPMYNRMNGGWMDENKTIKWTPEAHGDSGNNNAYYDHDTLRVLVPFTLNQEIGLSRLRMSVGNRLNAQEVDLQMVSSKIRRYDRTTQALIGECDARTRTIDVFRSTSLEIGSLDFDTYCITPQDSMVWELLVEINAERTPSFEGAGFRAEDIVFNIEELTNGCWKNTSYAEYTYVVSEVFIPRLLQINGGTFFSVSSMQIADQIPVGLTTNTQLSSLAVYIEGAPYIYEHRETQWFSKLEFTVPDGFELINDELVITINKDSIFQDADGRIQFGIADTIMTIAPRSKTTNGEGSTLTYDIDRSVFELVPIDRYVSIIGTLQSLCPPRSSSPTLSLSGSMEYIDYYQGSGDVIPYDFDIANNVRFLPEDYNLEDDFKIINNVTDARWILDRIGANTSSLFGNNSAERLTITYRAKGSRIDSIRRHLIALFPFESDTSYALPIYNQTDSTLSFDIDPVFESTFRRAGATGLELFTSDHRCGYDTLIFMLGNSILWERGRCLEAAFQDTIITYTPIGIPDIRFIVIPEEANFCDRTQLQLEITNVGEGGLANPYLIINSPELVSPSMTIIDADGPELRLDIPTYSEGGYLVNLSNAGIDTLLGLRDSLHQRYTIILGWEEDCSSPSNYNFSLQLGAFTYCGDSTVTSDVRSGIIPVTQAASDDINIQMTSYTDGVCDTDIHMSVSIAYDGSTPLEGDSLIIILPGNYPYNLGSATLDEAALDDPIIRDNEGFQFLIWTDILNSNSNSNTIEFSLDSSCGEVCASGLGQALLIANSTINCDQGGGNCERAIVRAYTEKIEHDWRPSFDITSLESDILSSEGAQALISLEINVKQENAIEYNGDVFILYFRDTNQNGLLDDNELIISNTTSALSADQLLGYSDTLSTSTESLCNLSVRISAHPTCDCGSTTERLDLFGRSGNRGSISLCGADTIDLTTYLNTACDETTSSNPNVIIADGIATYNRDQSRTYEIADTVVIDQNCTGCQRSDTIFIVDAMWDVEISTSDFDCQSGSVTLIGLSSLPDISITDYEWNDDPTLNESTLTVDSSQEVMLTARSSDGCIASVSTTIEIELLDYRIDTVIDSCATDAIASVNIALLSATDDFIVTWEDGFVGASRDGLSEGRYPIRLVGGACVIEDEIIIQGSNPIAITYPLKIDIAQGESVTINPLSGNPAGLLFVWEGDVELSCSDCPSPTIRADVPSILTVTITDEAGCSITSEIRINVALNRDIYIPNTFAPDSRVNSIFIPSDHPSITMIAFMKVYDRWGNEVFYIENFLPSDSDQGWDGRFNGVPLSSGVYAYHILFILADGNLKDTVGTVTLLR